MTETTDWHELAEALSDVLHLAAPPIGITFAETAPEHVPAFDEPMSEPEADGRRGRVPAGCVFWMRAATRTFSTVAADHGNCSVGSYTHGFVKLSDVAENSDVAALLGSGWVTEEAVGGIPAVAETPGSVVYGPLADTPAAVEPDVVLVRVNARQLMVLSDALPGLRIEGKPQCHIVAIAKEEGVPAASVGCALSRARTGMPPDEMTCALPAAGLADTVLRVRDAAAVDGVVAKYA
ncbi:MAG TPA: DUF169 domain-containing protein, partial [Acidimicrobiales bacterium]|nr:DUF169 domain-containing protein [Acidimicrobiales bacterium]